LSVANRSRGKEIPLTDESTPQQGDADDRPDVEAHGWSNVNETQVDDDEEEDAPASS